MDNIATDKSVLTDEAQANLVELAAYLKNYATKIAEANRLKKSNAKATGFDLDHFFEDHHSGKHHNCSTTACAVGHFAIMRGYDPSFEGVNVEGDTSMGWRTFSAKVIGISPSGEHELIWDWLFAGVWSECDNTPLGVVARIEYFLEHGVPDDFNTELFSFIGNTTPEDITGTYIKRRYELETECGVA